MGGGINEWGVVSHAWDSVWDDEKAMEMHRDDNCTTIWIYIILFENTFGNGEIGTCMLYIFNHNEKKNVCENWEEILLVKEVVLNHFHNVTHEEEKMFKEDFIITL